MLGVESGDLSQDRPLRSYRAGALIQVKG
jgi:hypothetical protein